MIVSILRKISEPIPCNDHGWLICESGWHALTIGKGVGVTIDSHFHALPDGQGRATRDGNLDPSRTSSQPWVFANHLLSAAADSVTMILASPFRDR